MDDAEVRRLREQQVEWAKAVGEADETKEKVDTLLMAFPNSLLLRCLAWVIGWVRRKSVEGEALARAAARKTYE